MKREFCSMTNLINPCKGKGKSIKLKGKYSQTHIYGHRPEITIDMRGYQSKSFMGRQSPWLICLALLALALTRMQTVRAAPTAAQHLAITVDGNTPRLIVTSKEIGIEPEMTMTKAMAPAAVQIKQKPLDGHKAPENRETTTGITAPTSTRTPTPTPTPSLAVVERDWKPKNRNKIEGRPKQIKTTKEQWTKKWQPSQLSVPKAGEKLPKPKAVKTTTSTVAPTVSANAPRYEQQSTPTPTATVIDAVADTATAVPAVMVTAARQETTRSTNAFLLSSPTTVRRVNGDNTKVMTSQQATEDSTTIGMLPHEVATTTNLARLETSSSSSSSTPTPLDMPWMAITKPEVGSVAIMESQTAATTVISDAFSLKEQRKAKEFTTEGPTTTTANDKLPEVETPALIAKEIPAKLALTPVNNQRSDENHNVVTHHGATLKTNTDGDDDNNDDKMASTTITESTIASFASPADDVDQRQRMEITATLMSSIGPGGDDDDDDDDDDDKKQRVVNAPQQDEKPNEKEMNKNLAGTSTMKSPEATTIEAISETHVNFQREQQSKEQQHQQEPAKGKPEQEQRQEQDRQNLQPLASDDDKGTGNDGIIKLIDLEKEAAHDLKSIDELKQQTEHRSHDDGHDGVKKIKKKQLLDKHFMSGYGDGIGIGTTESSESTVDGRMEEATASEVIPATTTTDFISSPAMSSSPTSTAASTILPSLSTHSPTLVPVFNGFLGPLIMAGKTFRAPHKPQVQHETFIESQLSSGRIVEIIAPTELVEPVTTPAATTEEATTSSTTVAAPTTTTLTSKQLSVEIEREAPQTPVLSTTVFQVAERPAHTTHVPANKKAPMPDKSIRTESKISDIQIEVYDSTVDSIVASTNFKDSEDFHAHPLEASMVSTSRPPSSQPAQEERFTQYVVDRIDSSTQESSVVPMNFVSGKPEPAAIEIHINVSEAYGTESEDLEFSYRQSDYGGNAALDMGRNYAPRIRDPQVQSRAKSNYSSDEILVVEIIDTGSASNSTENSASAENMNPVITFRGNSDAATKTDELFMADVKRDEENFSRSAGSPPPPPLPPRKPPIDRDSDTIFYISNTEVKVGESLPTPDTVHAAITQQQQQQRYEEDIILSPLRNTADSLKIFRSSGDGAIPSADITYVGESIMEVEQSSGAGIGTTVPPLSASAASESPSPQPDVIIQPAVLPAEMSIGVPVIGELPPQIELKEIDFMPDEANQLRSGVFENDIVEMDGDHDDHGDGNGNGAVAGIPLNVNDVESGIQYGGDLIDVTAGGGGFDGVEGSYPFGNLAAMRAKTSRNEADYTHFMTQHGVNNLQKSELSVDVSGSGEMATIVGGGGGAAHHKGGDGGAVGADAAGVGENATLKDALSLVGNETQSPAAAAASATSTTKNGTQSEKMSNASSYVILQKVERPWEARGWEFFYFCIFAAILLPSAIMISTIVFCTTRCIYLKIQRRRRDDNDNNLSGEDDAERGGDGGAGGDGGVMGGGVGGDQIQFEIVNTNPNWNRDQEPDHHRNHHHQHHDHHRGQQQQQEQQQRESPSDQNSNTQLFNTTNTTTITTATTHRHVDEARRSKDIGEQQNRSYHPLQAFHGPNGSVTKMTLKNNHLIVETEERNDISRNARELKMHYNNCEKDGVFVVEVSRGIDSKALPESPIGEPEQKFPMHQTRPNAIRGIIHQHENEKHLKNQEEVQIHSPPPDTNATNTDADAQRSLHKIQEVEEPAMSPVAPSEETDDSPNDHSPAMNSVMHKSQTGMSQSDLSSTSSNDSNKRYAYGNQELYVMETKGYDTNSPTTHQTPSGPKPLNNARDDDDPKSKNGHSLANSPPVVVAVEVEVSDAEEKRQEGGVDVGGGDGRNENSVSQLSEGNNAAEVKEVEATGEGEKQMSAKDQRAMTMDKPHADDNGNENGENETSSTMEQPSAEKITMMVNDGVLDGVTIPNEMAACAAVEEAAKKTIEVISDVNENGRDSSSSSNKNNNNNNNENGKTDENMNIDSEVIQSDASESGPVDELPPSENYNAAINVQPAPGDPAVTASVESEFGYDSIMSLPDPPTTEEFQQLNDYPIADISQLDSLPPPPPPPPLIAAAEDDVAIDKKFNHAGCPINRTETSDRVKQQHLGLMSRLKDEAVLTNGDAAAFLSSLPPPPEIIGNGKIVHATLTPPASPPAHFGNAVNGGGGGICGGPIQVAVDVNGS